MKKSLLIIALFTIIAASCSKDTDVMVQMKWNDSQNFDLKGKWKASIYKGALTFISNDEYAETALETKNTTVGSSSIDFTVNFKSTENYTVVVFFDDNGNDKFDEGENCDVEFDTVEAGEAITYEMEIDY